MKTFKQFNEEARQLDEALPLLAAVPAALKLGGAALTAYSAGSALNNLRKGKFKQAAFDAIGAIPGGKVFKGIRALGGAKNLAKAGSFVQSANRFNATGLTPNAYAKGVDKTFDVATKAVTSPFKGNKKNTKPTTTTPSNRNNPSKPKPFDPSKYKVATAKTYLGPADKKKSKEMEKSK